MTAVPEHDVADYDEAPAVAEDLERKVYGTAGAILDHNHLHYETSSINLNWLHFNIRGRTPWARCE
jgi:hypothetical protein